MHTRSPMLASDIFSSSTSEISRNLRIAWSLIMAMSWAERKYSAEYASLELKHQANKTALAMPYYLKHGFSPHLVSSSCIHKFHLFNLKVTSVCCSLLTVSSEEVASQSSSSPASSLNPNGTPQDAQFRFLLCLNTVPPSPFAMDLTFYLSITQVSLKYLFSPHPTFLPQKMYLS